jgi:sialidase-1
MTRFIGLAFLATAAALCGCASAPPAGPFLEKIDLFEADKEGYKLYRIPGIVVTTRGTALAYCEARKSDKGDWGDIDIMLRRSTDGGRTWSPRRHIAHFGVKVPKNPAALAQKLATPEESTVNNPVLIVDRKTGAVHFLYCVEYARAFHCRSDDDGLTFSRPVEITPVFEQFRRDYDWRVIATGPAHGIQLRSGRLVVPVWISTSTGGHAHRPSVASTIHSDDHGKTWRRGEIALPDTAEHVIPNETVAVELADGRVMLNSRTESPAHRRLVTISPDGATRWSPPRFQSELLEPICMASIVRLTTTADSDKNRILFANPHNLDRADKNEQPGKPRDRKNVSIKLTYDEGQTWPVNKLLEDGPSAYSDLAVLPDGTVLCFYERSEIRPGTRTNYGKLTVARFNLQWITDGKDALK